MSSDQGNSGLRTQAHLLPKKAKKTRIENIDKLEEDTDFAEWTNTVWNTLRPLRLRNLVNSELPRPKENDPEYDVWEYYSTVVGGWLYTQCSPAIRHRLNMELPEEISDHFADDVMDSIEKIILMSNRYEDVEGLIKKFTLIKLTDYRKPYDFIDDFERQLQHLQCSKVPIPTVYALVILLEQLGKEYPFEVKKRREELKDLQPGRVTLAQLREICEDIRIIDKNRWNRRPTA